MARVLSAKCRHRLSVRVKCQAERRPIRTMRPAPDLRTPKAPPPPPVPPPPPEDDDVEVTLLAVSDEVFVTLSEMSSRRSLGSAEGESSRFSWACPLVSSGSNTSNVTVTSHIRV